MAPILRECQNKCRKLSLDLDNTCNARSKSKANTCQTNNNSSCVVDATHATGNGNADEAITTDLCTSLEPLLKSSLKKLSLLTGLRELLEMFDNFVDGQYE